MKIRVVKTTDAGFTPLIKRILARRGSREDAVEKRVAEIVAAVKKEGDRALLRFTRLFDHVQLTSTTMEVKSAEIERAMTAGDDAAVARAKGQLLAAAAVIGVLASTPDDWFSGGADDALKAEVEQLLAERVTARAAKDWATADRIRDRLSELNVVVMDGPTGATWRLKD